MTPLDSNLPRAGIAAVCDHAQIQTFLERHDAGLSHKGREVPHH